MNKLNRKQVQKLLDNFRRKYHFEEEISIVSVYTPDFVAAIGGHIENTYLLTINFFKLNNCARPVEVIGHELLHILQLRHGRLQLLKDHVSWEGKLYSNEQVKLTYPSNPWEKEAYHLQGDMAKIISKVV